MRWKNRLVKMYVDIPEDCPNDEEFALDLADVLDNNNWSMGVSEEADAERAKVNKVVVGEIIIEPEE